jgi:hypothetical protein
MQDKIIYLGFQIKIKSTVQNIFVNLTFVNTNNKFPSLVLPLSQSDLVYVHQQLKFVPATLLSFHSNDTLCACLVKPGSCYGQYWPLHLSFYLTLLVSIPHTYMLN